MYNEFTSIVASSEQFLEEGVLDSETSLLEEYFKEKRRIFDLGTGRGRIPRYLACSGICSEIYGVDSNPNMIALANRFIHPEVAFVHEDILSFLKREKSASGILILGNSLGGILDETYREDMLDHMYESITSQGVIMIDYRPMHYVINHDVIIERHQQEFGELIVTEESFGERKVHLCQYYPDSQRLNQWFSFHRFQINRFVPLNDSKFYRQIAILSR